MLFQNNEIFIFYYYFIVEKYLLNRIFSIYCFKITTIRVNLNLIKIYFLGNYSEQYYYKQSTLTLISYQFITVILFSVLYN